MAWTQDEESDRTRALRRLTHRTIKKVSDDIQNRFHFNTAIAAIMEMANELGRINVVDAEKSPNLSAALKEAVRTMVLLLSPFVPHIAEEMWEALGENPGMVKHGWPPYDLALLEQDEVLIVVQVNGKKRAEISLPSDASEEEVRAAGLEEPNVQKFVEGKTIRKVIMVPGRLMNVVVG
jgi:leucyl-tRNA synthetase